MKLGTMQVPLVRALSRHSYRVRFTWSPLTISFTSELPGIDHAITQVTSSTTCRDLLPCQPDHCSSQLSCCVGTICGRNVWSDPSLSLRVKKCSRSSMRRLASSDSLASLNETPPARNNSRTC